MWNALPFFVTQTLKQASAPLGFALWPAAWVHRHGHATSRRFTITESPILHICHVGEEVRACRIHLSDVSKLTRKLTTRELLVVSDVSKLTRKLTTRELLVLLCLVFSELTFLRKGQLNRHTRYRPATTTRNTATQRSCHSDMLGHSVVLFCSFTQDSF